MESVLHAYKTLKPGALLVQIKETFIQLIAGTDLLVTEIRRSEYLWGIRVKL